MTGAVCAPLSTLVSTAECERRPDRFVELLDCLADLLVQARGERQRIQDANLSGDPRVSEALERLADVEGSLVNVAADAAQVHQQLRHLRLI